MTVTSPMRRASLESVKAPDIDPVAVERRLAGDRSVRLTTAERFEIIRRWVATGRSLNECKRVTGLRPDRYLPKGGRTMIKNTTNTTTPKIITDPSATADDRRLDCQQPGVPEFTDARPWEMVKAAAICATCPLSDACLSEGQRLQEAYDAGRDPYGAYGCWGGWWFEPGKEPKLIEQPKPKKKSKPLTAAYAA